MAELVKDVDVTVNKRARLIFLATCVAFSLIGNKFLLDRLGRGGFYLFEVALLNFIIVYFGLLWAFNFVVNKRSLLLILPQSALFVVAEAMFVQLLFDRIFVRTFEFFLLVFVAGILFTTSYVSFLMTNVFNVSQFGEIPLRKVAKTVSFIVTSLMIYFATYGILAIQQGLPLTLLALTVIYFVIVTLHYVHLDMKLKDIIRTASAIVWSMVVVALAMLFWGDQNELTAMIPTITAFMIIGIDMHHEEERFKTSKVVVAEYVAIFVVIFLLNLWLNRG